MKTAKEICKETMEIKEYKLNRILEKIPHYDGAIKLTDGDLLELVKEFQPQLLEKGYKVTFKKGIFDDYVIIDACCGEE